MEFGIAAFWRRAGLLSACFTTGNWAINLHLIPHPGIWNLSGLKTPDTSARIAERFAGRRSCSFVIPVIGIIAWSAPEWFYNLLSRFLPFVNSTEENNLEINRQVSLYMEGNPEIKQKAGELVDLIMMGMTENPQEEVREEV